MSLILIEQHKIKAAVVSNSAQYRVLKDHLDGHSVRLFCDNPEYHRVLQGEGVSVRLLDDFLIRPSWHAANTWAADRAAGFIRFCREEKFFNDLDLASVIFLRFSYYLANLVRNLFYATHVLESSPDRVVVFDSSSASFPAIQGNVALNRFLSQESARRGLSVETVVCSGASSRVPPVGGFFRRSFENLYARWVSTPDKSADVLAFGSLTHLSPVLSRLRQQGAKVALFDDAFHLKAFLFARRFGICYCTASCLSARAVSLPDSLVETWKRAFWKAADSGFFRFEGHDLGATIADQATRDVRSVLTTLLKPLGVYESILNGSRFKALLIDEDVTAKRALFAAYAKSRCIPVFCVSHANMAVPFSVSPKNAVYSQSVTFVHSEFERDNYIARGWDASSIVITGTPRFDRLASFRRPPRRKDASFRLFYCGASLRNFSPDEMAYLGIHIANYAEVQSPTLEKLLNESLRCDFTLTAKPHSMEGKRWQNFFKRASQGRRVKVVDYSEDFVQALLGCDAMAVAHWSTAIFEAAILGIPTLLLDFFGAFESAPHALRFTSARWIRKTEEISAALAEWAAQGMIAGGTPCKDDRVYWLGCLDGQGTQRVVGEIFRRTKEADLGSVKFFKPAMLEGGAAE